MSDFPPGPPAGPVPPDRGRPDRTPADGAAPDGTPSDALPSDAVLGAGAPDWAALARVWAGEHAAERELHAAGDAEDDADVQRWLAAHPDEAVRMTALDRLLDASFAAGPADAAPVDVEAALAQVTRRRLAESAPAESAPAAPTTPTPAPARRTPAPAWTTRPAAPRWSRRRLTGIGVATVALLAAGIGLARRWTQPVGFPSPDVAVTPATQHHRTAVGQRDSVRLADGTRVLLGPATSLDVLPGYGGTARTVTLNGEAYFEVVHDGARPFSVIAGPAVVHDLGTAFTVRHDDADHIAVAVTQGAVRLSTAEPSADPATPATQPGRPRSTPRLPQPSTGDSGLVLRAGERGVVAPDARRTFTATRLSGPAADDTAWTSGRLVFRDAPLPEVAAALRRWYGVELRATSPELAGRHLTATFRGEPLPEVLRVVGLALGARLDRRGDTVLVRPPR